MNVFTIKIWLPRYYTETISFASAYSATRNEKFFIEMDYPNVKTC